MLLRKCRNPDTSKSSKVADKTVIEFNDWITVRNIPKRCHEYPLGSRSALDWVVDQWQIKTHKESGIVNDPNTWAEERDDPRYILDLIGRVVTVSMHTLDIIESLPPLNLAGR